MRQTVEAIYENGVLQPLEPLNLPDHERVSVTVEPATDEDWLDRDAKEWAKREGDPNIPLDDVRKRLAKITGSMSDVVIAERGDY
jgi:predicted DNA-binding antitoxin AbrB/MazE fold protein